MSTLYEAEAIFQAIQAHGLFDPLSGLAIANLNTAYELRQSQGIAESILLEHQKKCAELMAMSDPALLMFSTMGLAVAQQKRDSFPFPNILIRTAVEKAKPMKVLLLGNADRFQVEKRMKEEEQRDYTLVSIEQATCTHIVLYFGDNIAHLERLQSQYGLSGTSLHTTDQVSVRFDSEAMRAICEELEKRTIEERAKQEEQKKIEYSVCQIF